jgi:hypothetical protein
LKVIGRVVAEMWNTDDLIGNLREIVMGGENSEIHFAIDGTWTDVRFVDHAGMILAGLEDECRER